MPRGAVSPECSHASPARQFPLFREAGRSSSKHSRARTLRVLQRRTRLGSAPHGRDRRPPNLSTLVGAFFRIYTITASLRHGRPESVEPTLRVASANVEGGRGSKPTGALAKAQTPPGADVAYV